MKQTLSMKDVGYFAGVPQIRSTIIFKSPFKFVLKDLNLFSKSNQIFFSTCWMGALHCQSSALKFLIGINYCHIDRRGMLGRRVRVKCPVLAEFNSLGRCGMQELSTKFQGSSFNVSIIK